MEENRRFEQPLVQDIDDTTVRGLVFITGRNIGPYVKDCLASLARQTYPHFDVLLVDDASTDDTVALAKTLLNELFAGRHQIVCNDTQYGKARNAHLLLRSPRQADFVAILDGDDQLVDDSILAEMAAAYRTGYDVVWSNYCTNQGGLGPNRSLDPFSSPRGQGWRTSHFFSFRRSLIDTVPASYFQDDQGQWLMSACDFAIAYPVLDQTRRYHFIPSAAYRYTVTNQNSHHNRDPECRGLSSAQQIANAKIVLKKKPLGCTRYVTDSPACLHSALAYKFSQLTERLDHNAHSLAAARQAIDRVPFVELALSELRTQEKIPTSWLLDTGGWALDPGFVYHLTRVMEAYANPRVLEFGSGRGSKSLARLCANRGGSLTSIEHDPKWFAQTRAEQEKYGLGGNARVLLCPLVDVEFFGVPGKFYDLKALRESDKFDIVVIDGPPTVTCQLARLPALPAVVPHLTTAGFHLFLDDYEREQEQKIVQMWRQVAPDFNYQTLQFAKQVCEITP